MRCEHLCIGVDRGTCGGHSQATRSSVLDPNDSSADRFLTALATSKKTASGNKSVATNVKARLLLFVHLPLGVGNNGRWSDVLLCAWTTINVLRR